MSISQPTFLGLSPIRHVGLAHCRSPEWLRNCLQEGVQYEIDNSTEIPSNFDFGIAADQQTHSHALETLDTRETHTRRAENTHRARAALKNYGAEGQKTYHKLGSNPGVKIWC